MRVLLYLNGERAAAEVFTGLAVRLDTVLKSPFVYGEGMNVGGCVGGCGGQRSTLGSIPQEEYPPFFLRHGYMSLELTDSAKLAQANPQRCTSLSLSMVLRLQGQATSPGFFT